MNTTIKTTQMPQYKTDTTLSLHKNTTLMKISLGLVGAVGIWGLACLIGGVLSAGLLGTVAGFVSAITGM